MLVYTPKKNPKHFGIEFKVGEPDYLGELNQHLGVS